MLPPRLSPGMKLKFYPSLSGVSRSWGSASGIQEPQRDYCRAKIGRSLIDGKPQRLNRSKELRLNIEVGVVYKQASRLCRLDLVSIPMQVLKFRAGSFIDIFLPVSGYEVMDGRMFLQGKVLRLDKCWLMQIDSRKL